MRCRVRCSQCQRSRQNHRRSRMQTWDLAAEFPASALRSFHPQTKNQPAQSHSPHLLIGSSKGHLIFGWKMTQGSSFFSGMPHPLLQFLLRLWISPSSSSLFLFSPSSPSGFHSPFLHLRLRLSSASVISCFQTWQRRNHLNAPTTPTYHRKEHSAVSGAEFAILVRIWRFQMHVPSKEDGPRLVGRFIFVGGVFLTTIYCLQSVERAIKSCGDCCEMGT